MKTLTKKRQLVKTAKEHRKADRFIQGEWINGKIDGKYSGCFFGCMIQSKDNTLEKASEEMDLPLWLVHLSEKIFEGLKQEEAVEFPVQLLEAIPVKKDLEYAYKRFFYSLLMDKKKGQITFTKKGSQQYKVIKQCADLFLMDEITESAAWSAAWSASSAAESAAWSAAESASSAAWSASSAASSAAWSAESAAWSAAESAAWSAESAARSASSAAWSAARSGYYSWLRDILIKSLKD